MIDVIKSIFAVIGAGLGYFFGGLDGLMIALIVFVVVDYVTGVIVAIINKTLSSEVGFIGIAKKVFIFLLVGIANILDVYVIKTGSMVRSAVICFYIANEGISIVENAGNMGLPLPKKLKDVLEQLKEKSEE